MKVIKYFFVSILIFLLLAGGSGIIFSTLYEEEVTTFLLTELRKQLDAKITFDNIKLSLLKKCPNASVEIQNLLIKPHSNTQFKLPGSDTIIFSEIFFLDLNIIDLLQKKYTLNAIEINNGKLNVVTTKGATNLNLFKKQKKIKGTKVKIDLQKLVLVNSELSYSNDRKKIYFEGFIKRAKLKGEFLNKEYSAQLNGDIFIKTFCSDTLEIVHSTPVSIKTNFYSHKTYFRVDKGFLKSGKNVIYYSGTINNKIFDLNVEGNPIQIESLHTLIPPVYKKYLKKYSCKGELYFNADISKKSENDKDPHIEVFYKVHNGTFKYLNKPFFAENVNLEGQYSNGEQNSLTSSHLNIEYFNSFLGGSNMQGTVEITNFNHPHFKINVSSHFFLGELQSFFMLDTLEKINGEIISNLNVSGYSKNKKIDLETKKGSIFFKNINFKFKDHPFNYTNINGGLTLDDDIFIDSLLFFINKNSFRIDGKLFNLLNYLTNKNQILLVEGNLESENFYLEDLLVHNPAAKDQDSALVLPNRLIGNLTFKLDRLNFKNFSADNIYGALEYEPARLKVTNVSFNAVDGEVKAKGQLIKTSEHTFFINSIYDIKEVNIRKLFYSFNNFGQKVLQNHHLQGTLTGQVIFSASLSEYLNINHNSIQVQSAININDGELIDFEPIKKMSKFIQLEELEHITFENINNKISIENKTIFIPQMDINTSAFNISGLGEQHFNGDFHYNIKVLLSELLAKKAKKEKNEFGIIEDDGLGKTSIFLSIEGNTEDYSIKYDRESAKMARKQKSAAEKKELKTILFEEFGWFKRDSAILKPDNEKTTKFIIEWEEDDEQEDKKREKRIKSNKNKSEKDTSEQKFNIEWE